MKTSLYRYFDDRDRLLYAGISHHPFNRKRQHWNTPKPMCDVRYIEIEWFDDRPSAEEAERHVIKTERPIWNISLKPKGRKTRATTLPHPEPEVVAPAVPEMPKVDTRMRLAIGNASGADFDQRFAADEFANLSRDAREGDTIAFGDDVEATQEQINALLDHVDGRNPEYKPDLTLGRVRHRMGGRETPKAPFDEPRTQQEQQQ